MNVFGTKFAERRKKLGYTQAQVADKLHVSKQAVSKWENGISMPDVTLLREIAILLDTTIDELLSENCAEENCASDKEPVISETPSCCATCAQDETPPVSTTDKSKKTRKLTLIIVPCAVALILAIVLPLALLLPKKDGGKPALTEAEIYAERLSQINNLLDYEFTDNYLVDLTFSMREKVNILNGYIQKTVLATAQNGEQYLLEIYKDGVLVQGQYVDENKLYLTIDSEGTVTRRISYAPSIAAVKKLYGTTFSELMADGVIDSNEDFIALERIGKLEFSDFNGQISYVITVADDYLERECEEAELPYSDGIVITYNVKQTGNVTTVFVIYDYSNCADYDMYQVRTTMTFERNVNEIDFGTKLDSPVDVPDNLTSATVIQPQCTVARSFGLVDGYFVFIDDGDRLYVYDNSTGNILCGYERQDIIDALISETKPYVELSDDATKFTRYTLTRAVDTDGNDTVKYVADYLAGDFADIEQYYIFGDSIYAMKRKRLDEIRYQSNQSELLKINFLSGEITVLAQRLLDSDHGILVSNDDILFMQFDNNLLPDLKRYNTVDATICDVPEGICTGIYEQVPYISNGVICYNGILYSQQTYKQIGSPPPDTRYKDIMLTANRKILAVTEDYFVASYYFGNGHSISGNTSIYDRKSGVSVLDISLQPFFPTVYCEGRDVVVAWKDADGQYNFLQYEC